MSMIVAVEDGLSEAVLRKIISVTRPDIETVTVLGNRGKGYLRNRARELNRAAGAVPVLMLIDQDLPQICPPALTLQWFGTTSPLLLFRVAVMEVESWVLADREGVASMLGVPVDRIPVDTDAIPQPKEFLVNLARRSRFTRVRQDFVPAPGSTAAVGPGYNPRLGVFAASEWNPLKAALLSRSLDRCIARLRDSSRIVRP
jgi:hypothetical protein